MKIDALQGFIPNINNRSGIDKAGGEEFKNVLTDFLGQVNQSQLDANKITNEFVQGGNVEVQDVMIAGERAKTSLELLMEIRNQTIDMYKQLTSMQI